MIYFKTDGNSKSKRLLVCIHGLTATHLMFEDLIKELNIEDLFIISPDLRGCGASIDIWGEFTINESVDDIKEILDLYENRKVILLGYSQGGTIAQLLAKTFPDRVSGLILCNTYAYNIATFREKIEAYMTLLIFHLFNLKTISNLLTRVIEKEKKISSKKIEDFRQMVRTNKKKALIAYAKQLITFDSRSWLNEIKQPTLIIRGQNDVAVPVHHTNMLSNAIPNSRTIIVENAGHAMIWSHTKQLAKVINGNFISK